MNIDIDRLNMESYEKARKYAKTLQVGDLVKLLKSPYIWGEEDYCNDYGDDLEPISLFASHLKELGWEFNIKDIRANELIKEVPGYRLVWDYKTRDLSYTHGNFSGGLEMVDTFDKMQKALRYIGLEYEADKFKPDLLHDTL